MRVVLKLGLLAAVFALVCTPCLAKECLKYSIKNGTNKVHLVGVVSVKPAFGPPDFGEHPETDSHEDFLAISLPRAICVKALDNDENEAEEDVNLLQLVFQNDKLFHDANSLVGRRVSIVGELMHRETGHHHTDVLIIVDRARILTAGEP